MIMVSFFLAVFAGEVDALDSVSVSGKPQYVEFKTSREFSHPRQQVNFKRWVKPYQQRLKRL